MKERHIPFSAPMVRALLAGTKTQTRRVVKHPCGSAFDVDNGWPVAECVDGETRPIPCPYGQPGDRLWVREAWRIPASLDADSGSVAGERAIAAGYRKPWAPVQYEADGARSSAMDWLEFGSTLGAAVPGRYRHARFMPRWASRITLEVTDVRVQRLHECTEADAIAEGIHRIDIGDGYDPKYSASPRSWSEAIEQHPDVQDTARGAYRELWESINGLGSWLANPWVWVVSFRRVQP